MYSFTHTFEIATLHKYVSCWNPKHVPMGWSFLCPHCYRQAFLLFCKGENASFHFGRIYLVGQPNMPMTSEGVLQNKKMLKLK